MLDWPFRLMVAGSCNTDSPRIRSAHVNGAQISCSAGATTVRIGYAPTAISWMKSRSALTFAGGRWREG